MNRNDIRYLASVAAAPTPEPHHRDSRTCFGIAFFTDEADANAYAAAVARRGDTYNGGILHGMACGRDVGFDYTDPTGQPFYAVTEA